MRIAVISDIHGNMEAFTTVLDDMDRQKVDTVVSLGDNIDYGADSEAVIQKMIARKIPSILGNHELACVNEKVYRWYAGDVKRSLDDTLSKLSLSSLKYLKRLPVNLSKHQAFFVHGFWPDSVRHYLHQKQNFELLFALQQIKESICFVGHTHRLGRVFHKGNDVHIRPLDQGRVKLEKETTYIINAGSVGQPRDGDFRAKYVIWDRETHSLDVRCLEYDNQAAAGKILAAGLPLKYARAVSQSISPE